MRSVSVTLRIHTCSPKKESEDCLSFNLTHINQCVHWFMEELHLNEAPVFIARKSRIPLGKQRDTHGATSKTNSSAQLTCLPGSLGG